MAFHLKKILLLTVFLVVCTSGRERLIFGKQKPKVVIAVLVRNKGTILPYFLTALNQLEYPRNKIILWIYTDYNSDDTVNIIEQWQQKYLEGYRDFNITISKTNQYHADETNGTSWTPIRHEHVIRLRQEALDYARNVLAEYIFMLDADVVLTNRRVLHMLMNIEDGAVVAPMLDSDESYSNFWHGMTKKYTYGHTKDYEHIVARRVQSELVVPLVHSAVLINLAHKKSALLAYDPKKAQGYDGQANDIVVFSINAKNHGIPLILTNKEHYGFVTAPVPGISDAEKERERATNIKLKALSRGLILRVHHRLRRFLRYPKPSTLGMDKIFMINLKRRIERKTLMMESFKELGMNVDVFEAVDGQYLNDEYLEMNNITVLPLYRDPRNNRRMNAGEIGCFMSHYSIWKKIIENKYNMTMILEDDVFFTPFFDRKLHRALQEAKRFKFDLLYLGRKILEAYGETRISDNLVRPLYSYWTLGYILTYDGARKLINAQPLNNLMPVDEFLPIMFNNHPVSTWKLLFPDRVLRAVAAHPPIVYPTHYTGQEGHISDTENSKIIKPRPGSTFTDEL